jgi:hypothetical protein
MKKVSVLILVAILGVVGWALPAGAGKMRLTDDQLDEIMAGAKNKGTVNSSIVGDNAGGHWAAFGQPAELVFCLTVPSGKCPTPKVVEGNASANASNTTNGNVANSSSYTGSASTITGYNGTNNGNVINQSNNASAPPPIAGPNTYPPGANLGKNAGGNTVIPIQFKF